MKVKVWKNNQYLGLGDHLGDVDIYFILLPDGNIFDLNNPEEKPDIEDYPQHSAVLNCPNPKIKLDSGEVYYGHQVVWHSTEFVNMDDQKAYDEFASKVRGGLSNQEMIEWLEDLQCDENLKQEFMFLSRTLDMWKPNAHEGSLMQIADANGLKYVTHPDIVEKMPESDCKTMLQTFRN